MLHLPSPALMPSRLGLATSLLLLVAPASGLAQRTGPDSASTVKKAAVTAITQGMVYLSAGRNDGLREGSVVRVPRLGERGRYVVAYLSSKSAACQGDSLSVLPAVGDSAVFVPAAPTKEAVAQSSGGTGSTVTAGRRRGQGLRGRVGIRYLGTTDRESGIALRQPGIELLLDGPIAPGAPVGLAVDIRSRRTSRYRPGQETTSEGLMGVYQAALRIQAPRGPFRAILGRQYAPTLAGVGLFDGLLLDVQRPTWGAGVMAGLAPDLATLGVSSELRQFGAFLQGRSAPSRPVRWSLSAGAMGSYAQQGEVNREFAFFQGTLGSRVFSAVLLQELDVNRGWKLEAGEAKFAPTSTFLSVNLTPARGVSFSGGLDNRRNARLYRDLVTPEEIFDDRFRFGAWGAMNFAITPKFRIGSDVRTSTVGGIDSLRTMAYSGSISLDRLTPLGLGLRARATRYETPGRGPGLLLAGSFRIAPGTGAAAFELTAGSRQEERMASSDRYWAGANLDVFLRRSWFALASFSREWGRNGVTPTTDQLYAGLSYRF